MVVLASAKGSPGVTTTAVALAATAPAGHRQAVLELDPSGGDLGPAFGLAAEPGLVSLASAARRDHRPGLVWEHLQQLRGGLAVVAAPAGAEQAATAVDVLLASPALRTLHHPGQGHPRAGNEEAERADEHVAAQVREGGLWVDAGRLPPRLIRGTGITRLLGQADIVLLVVRNDSAGIAHAAARLASVSSAVGEGSADSAAGVLRLLLVGSGGYPTAEVAQALGTPVAGTLPWDPRAAAVLAGRPARRVRNLGRLPLLRAAAVIVARLTAEPRYAPATALGHRRSPGPHPRHEPSAGPSPSTSESIPDTASGSVLGASADAPVAAVVREEARP